MADLVILNSNPIDDIARASDIDSVMKNGILYPADAVTRQVDDNLRRQIAWIS